MDKFREKQDQIDKQRKELISRYRGFWKNILAEWKSPGPDRAWLMYSANYLLNTSKILWALDPLTPYWRIKDATPGVNINDLADLSFVLLTHNHKDHLDLDLISGLRNFPITWVVPDFLLSTVNGQAGILRKRILIPESRHPFCVDGIVITPYEGMHWEILQDGTPRGLPSMAYLVEFNDKRWFFPGDTRSFDISLDLNYGHLDGLFAHLWMGRGCALLDSPQLMESFCNFFAKMKSNRIVLTHLMEFGRDAEDFWDLSHAQAAISFFQSNYPGIKISYAITGEKVLL
jgi:L-ascorbate metabolism protein UlaG (beta-lactamase superfamily)